MQNLIHRLLAQLKTGLRGLWRESESTRSQMREIFSSTSDQVLEKAEETRKAVRLRMAQMEIEHYLNRLYPQIGKQFCDQFEPGKRSFSPDEDLRLKLELAADYRRRLEELRTEIVEEQSTGSPED